jgi:hypothetical protein
LENGGGWGPVTAIDGQLSYDPDIIEITGLTSGAWTVTQADIIPGPGALREQLDYVANGGNATDLLIGTITYTAKAAGTTSLAFHASNILHSSDGNWYGNNGPTRNGSVTVTGVTLAPFTDGSFELGSSSTVWPYPTSLDHWDIGGDGINWGGYWASPDGSAHVIDLNKDSYQSALGSVSQTFATDVGETYQVSFSFAGNGGCTGGGEPNNIAKTLEASIDGTVLLTPSVTANGSFPGWSTQTFTFVADDGATTLMLESQNVGRCGPVIDAVGVVVFEDLDNDGVNDVDDDCLGTAAGTEVGTDGCPWDSDDDGVNDDVDACPDDAGTGADGCPTKRDILDASGVGGKAISENTAPGLQKGFNPKGKGAENAGKKSR